MLQCPFYLRPSDLRFKAENCELIVYRFSHSCDTLRRLAAMPQVPEHYRSSNRVRLSTRRQMKRDGNCIKEIRGGRSVKTESGLWSNTEQATVTALVAVYEPIHLGIS